jgi:endonuclease III
LLAIQALPGLDRKAADVVLDKVGNHPLEVIRAICFAALENLK